MQCTEQRNPEQQNDKLCFVKNTKKTWSTLKIRHAFEEETEDTEEEQQQQQKTMGFLMNIFCFWFWWAGECE